MIATQPHKSREARKPVLCTIEATAKDDSGGEYGAPQRNRTAKEEHTSKEEPNLVRPKYVCTYQIIGGHYMLVRYLSITQLRGNS